MAAQTPPSHGAGSQRTRKVQSLAVQGHHHCQGWWQQAELVGARWSNLLQLQPVCLTPRLAQGVCTQAKEASGQCYQFL